MLSTAEAWPGTYFIYHVSYDMQLAGTKRWWDSSIYERESNIKLRLPKEGSTLASLEAFARSAMTQRAGQVIASHTSEWSVPWPACTVPSLHMALTSCVVCLCTTLPTTSIMIIRVRRIVMLIILIIIIVVSKTSALHCRMGPQPSRSVSSVRPKAGQQ